LRLSLSLGLDLLGLLLGLVLLLSLLGLLSLSLLLLGLAMCRDLARSLVHGLTGGRVRLASDNVSLGGPRDTARECLGILGIVDHHRGLLDGARLDVVLETIGAALVSLSAFQALLDPLLTPGSSLAVSVLGGDHGRPLSLGRGRLF
jgi:hypothetical protein